MYNPYYISNGSKNYDKRVIYYLRVLIAFSLTDCGVRGTGQRILDTLCFKRTAKEMDMAHLVDILSNILF